MDGIFEALAGFIGILVLIAALALVMTFPVMWCWNYVMPDLFGLQEVTFWQALVLSLLSSMLFKSSSTNSKD